MSSTDDTRDAQRLLDGLENGRLSARDAATLARDLDPVLLYVIVTFLRRVYPASDPAATSVLDRVVEMTKHAADAVKKNYAAGERDPISRWFESEHSYSSYRGRGSEMLRIVLDKLDG